MNFIERETAMSKSKNRKQRQLNAGTKPSIGASNSQGNLVNNEISLYLDLKVAEGIKEIKRKFWPYTLGIIAVGIASFWGLFQGIKDEIQKRLTSEYVADTLNEHIAKFTDEKVTNVADSRISIAERRIIEGFEKKVAEQEAMLARSSAAAETQIKSLQSALAVMKKAYDARGGDRKAFDEIAALSTNKTEAGEIASKVIHEIEAIYQNRKEKENTGLFGSVRQTVSYNGSDGRHGPISFADATMIIISHNRAFEEGAIHRLVDSRQKEFVEVLMVAITESPSLDSVYSALRGIEKLAEATFPVLGVDAAVKWWEEKKCNSEYHSPYASAWKMFFSSHMKPRPNESNEDYYRRVVIPLHDAIVAKQDLCMIARPLLRIAFGYGFELLGKMEDVDCLSITKDLISNLGNGAEAQKLEFKYTMDTMALYEKASGEALFNYAVRSIKANPNLIDEFSHDETFTPEFKDAVARVVEKLDEHTKGISFVCAMSDDRNGGTKFLSPIADGKETLHNLNLIARKDKTFVVKSSGDIEIPTGEIGTIPFSTKSKQGRIILLNHNGIPVLFDVQIDKNAEDSQ